MRYGLVLVLGALSIAAAACGSSEDDPSGSGGGGSGGSAGNAGSAGSGGAAGSSGSAGSAGAAGSGGSAGACPLPLEARELVNELMQKTVQDAIFVSSESHSVPARIGLGLSLVGSWNGLLASFSPLETCSAGAAKWYEAYCDEVDPAGEEFWLTRASCSRWGCDAAGNTLGEVWFTVRPQKTLEPRHAFTYPFQPADGSALMARTGSVEWVQNPYILWTRTDASDGSVQVVADAEHAVKVVFDGGPTVDLSHTAHINLTNAPDGHAQSLLAAMVFSAIAGSDTISGSVELVDPATNQFQGNVVNTAFDVLATLSQSSDTPLTLVWQGICAP